jgi:predicted Rossmann fold flavoprotein
MPAPPTYDAIIIGAGAAGLFCAAQAGQRGRKVLLVDHAVEPGAKILISGGGRCNFTNVGASAANYISANPHFMKSALGRYRPADFVELVDSYRIAWHEKTLGQLFCDGSSKQIVGLLMRECGKGGVKFAFGQATDIEHRGGLFHAAGASAPRLVLATGGLSIPKLGATSFAYDVARRFGHKIVEPRPALVPLTLPPEGTLFKSLSGVATQVVASAGKARFREAALFTHRGLSGPAILQASSYWHNGESIGIDFLPDAAKGWLKDRKRSDPRSHLRTAVAAGIPDRLALALVDELGVSGDLGNIPDRTLDQVEARLRDWRFFPNGSEGFAKAEVTVGGISTEHLSSKTMESTRVPGLFAIGEAVDVTGWLGGYNFQWAWASGFAAGQAL